MRSENLLGYTLTSESASGIAEQVSGYWAAGRRRLWFACLNPHSYVVAEQDKGFADALRNAHILVPDGAGIVLASRRLHGQIAERVTGYDVFKATMAMLSNQDGGGRVFFLGSTEEVLAKIADRFAKDYPSLQLVGAYSPPFKAEFSDSDNQAMIDRINEASPDVLWVGMTAPKQEKWLAETISKLDVGFAGAIGAVFDFYAGTVARSPEIFQRLGLEWLPRLLREPRRLWRRNFISTPKFLFAVFKARFAGRYAR